MALNTATALTRVERVFWEMVKLWLAYVLRSSHVSGGDPRLVRDWPTFLTAGVPRHVRPDPAPEAGSPRILFLERNLPASRVQPEQLQGGRLPDMLPARRGGADAGLGLLALLAGQRHVSPSWMAESACWSALQAAGMFLLQAGVPGRRAGQARSCTGRDRVPRLLARLDRGDILIAPCR